MNRDFSIVPVRRLDLDSVKETVMRQIKDYPYTEDIFDVVADDVWGVVETVYGLYPVSKTGQMPQVSLSSGGSFIINFHPILDTGELVLKNGTSIKVDINNIKNFEFDFAEPLSDFIARLGPETERVYNIINDFFLANIITTMDDLIEVDTDTPLEEGEVEIEIENTPEEVVEDSTEPCIASTEEDTVKFSKFIIKDKCTCKDSEVLVYVDKQGICACKYFPKHRHCSKCGGRITKKG